MLGRPFALFVLAVLSGAGGTVVSSGCPAEAAPPRVIRDASGALDTGWAEFLRQTGGGWSGRVDTRTGRLVEASGSGIPWIGGRGNRLPKAPTTDAIAVLEQKALYFADAWRELLGLCGFDLQFDREHSGSNASGDLWHLVFHLSAEGIPIQDAEAVFVVRHGNLTRFWIEAPSVPPRALLFTIPREDPDVIVSRFTREHPLMRLRKGSLKLLWRYGADGDAEPVWNAIAVELGGSTLVTFSARDGSIRDRRSLVARGQVMGGVRLRNALDSETSIPLPGVRVSDGMSDTVTDAAGRFNLSGYYLLADLSGTYSNVRDDCGPSAVSGAGELLSFEASPGHDCSSPFPNCAGNTSGARTAAFHVALLHAKYRSYLGSGSWLNFTVSLETNYPSPCESFVIAGDDHIILSIGSSGSPCRNGAENPGVVAHEWGHVLQNKAIGLFLDAASREGFADVVSLMQFHESCVAAGWLQPGYNSGEQGTTCDGLHELDAAKLSPPLPATPQNLTDPPYSCWVTPGDEGISGLNGHCESHILSESIWDLSQAFAAKYGPVTGWERLQRLWADAVPLVTFGWNLVDPGPPIVANGCQPWNWYEVLRLVDDDNGDLSDGVPDGAEIYAAFSRHGVACDTDPAFDVSYGTCPVLQAPTITTDYDALNDGVTVRWSAISGATGYEVLRSELGPQGAFTRIAVLGGDAASFFDGEGTARAIHWYAIVAVQNGCLSPLSVPVASWSCPSAVDLVSPATGAVIADSDAEMDFEWTFVPNATVFDFCLSPDDFPRTCQTVTGTMATVTGHSLEPSITYSWKVGASNAVPGCVPVSSSVRSLTVVGEASPPVVLGTVPTHAPAEGGVPVTVFGYGLYLGATVRLGGVPVSAADVRFVDSTALVVVVPPYAGTEPEIVVVNPSGLESSPFTGFTYDRPPGTAFYTVTPCRLVDTRQGGPLGGPPLSSGVPRSFTLAGQCGIPIDARVLSVNVTVTNATGSGIVRLFRPDAPEPGTSNVSFRAAQTRAAASIIELSRTSGPALAADALLDGGRCDLIIDVNGYFR